MFFRFLNHGQFSEAYSFVIHLSTGGLCFIDIKEHVAITIMAATASDSALAISIFAAQDLYYSVIPNPAVGVFTLGVLYFGICVTDFSQVDRLPTYWLRLGWYVFTYVISFVLFPCRADHMPMIGIMRRFLVSRI